MATADNSTAMVTLRGPFFGPSTSEYYGRMMVWIDSASADRQWSLLETQGRVPGETYDAEYNFGGFGSKLYAGYDTSHGALSDCMKTGGPVPFRRWVCFEWHFKREGMNGEIEAWIDKVPDEALHVRSQGAGNCDSPGTMGNWYPPRFEIFRVGFRGFAPDAIPRDIWIDDLVLSSAPIGCPR